MDSQLSARIDALEKKIDATYQSAEKTRKYILGMLVATVVAFVLPLVGLMFAIPTLLSTYSGMADVGALDL
ncbi:MAG: hypothetical protein WAX38_00390 [Minisyncoccia bacterium]